MSRNELPLNHVLNSGTVFDNCSALTNWSATFASTISLDATYGIKMTATAATGSCHMSKTINTYLGDTESIDFLLYIPDLTNIASVVFYLSNATSGLASNSYSATFYNNPNIQLTLGWNRISIPRARFAQTGATNWNTNMQTVRILVNIQNNAAPIIYLKEIKRNKKCRKLAVITSDDGFAGAATFLPSYFNSLNSGGGRHSFGILVSKGYAEQGDANPGSSLYATTAQLQAVYDAGYELCNHTVNQIDNVKNYTTQQMIDEILGNEQWLLSKGWTRGSTHFAYPGPGLSWSRAAIDWILANTNIKSARTSLNIYASNPYPEVMQLPQVSIPDIGFFYGTTYAQYQIDMAADCGASIFLSCHDIRDTNVHGLSILTSAFGLCMDYVLKKGFELVAPEEWYNLQFNPRRLI